MANGVRRRGLGRSLAFAIGAFIISNLGAATVNWLSQLAVTPVQSAALSTGVGLVVVVLTVVLDSFKEPAPAVAGTVYSGRVGATGYAPGDQPYPPQGYPQQGHRQQYSQQGPAPVPKAARRVSWAVVLIVLIGLCGFGGFGAAWGVQWANGKAICLLDPKHYDGEERLAGPAGAVSGRLAMEVTRVVVSQCGTIITVHAVNGGDVPLELPVFGNTSLTVPGRTSLGGDPRTSDWGRTVPANGEMTGVLVFKQIPDDVSQVTLSFATVFGRPDGARGISVRIPLTTVSES